MLRSSFENRPLFLVYAVDWCFGENCDNELFVFGSWPAVYKFKDELVIDSISIRESLLVVTLCSL